MIKYKKDDYDKVCDMCGMVIKETGRYNANLKIQHDNDDVNYANDPYRFAVILDMDICDNCFESGTPELLKITEQLLDLKKHAELKYEKLNEKSKIPEGYKPSQIVLEYRENTQKLEEMNEMDFDTSDLLDEMDKQWKLLSDNDKIYLEIEDEVINEKT